MSLVLIDVWTYGKAVMPEQHRQRRLGWCDLWARETPEGNPFAHPISGLKLLVDMNTLELLEIEDHHDYGQPAVDAEYIPSVRGTQVRTDLKPLHITQPDGASFTVEGAELKWQNWTMRLGFNYREGPVIYQVTFDDHGTIRDIAYRMSFAEMVVPYRDPTFDHYRRTAYDIGEWGLGFMTTSLELGCDCLGEVAYLDATLHDSKGEPVRDPQRDLPARGGQRRALEARRRAHRRRGPPAAADGGVLPRDGGQLRVPHLLAVLPGRQHRVRGPGHRPDGHHPVPRGRAGPAVRHRRRHEHLRAVPPAFPGGPTRPRRRRRREHGDGGRLGRPAGVGGEPVRAGPGHPLHPDPLGGGVRPRLRLGHPARVEGRQPQQGQQVRHQRRPTSWCPGRASRR